MVTAFRRAVPLVLALVVTVALFYAMVSMCGPCIEP